MPFKSHFVIFHFYFLAIPVPMYISQRIGDNRVCIIENENNNVVQLAMDECLDVVQPDYATASAWQWLGQFNIQ